MLAQEMLNRLLPQIGELMMDSFANYLIQKLNKLALDTQIDLLFKYVRLVKNNIKLDPAMLRGGSQQQAWNASIAEPVQAHHTP